MKNLLAISILLVILIPGACAAAPDDDAVRVKSWAVSLRLGGFSTSNDGTCHRHMPRGTIGLEFTSFIDEHSAYSLTLDGHAFAGDYIAMMPISVSYKLFPLGNNSFRFDGEPGSKLLPWLGGGVGIHLNGPHRDSIADISFGAHLSCGVVIPFGSLFAVDTELRYTATSDIRMFNYLLGFGFRF